ncbi:MAG: hypothetical protein CVV42_12310 [Candidatus Riflebacteria bacterium HGW-Riflebacteria-2]|jgi:hypothetical protein|nr:MAG: hypothetical protein CVV42_12310 [Candidatus Riflebacteria bacterium HGW-Riflebacteria-2]
MNSLRTGSRHSGVTLLETMLAVAMLSLLFASANSILSYSRRETEKGFWIQQGITQLRNGTRAITDMLKKTSYPSTIVRDSGGNETVTSFKEKREYDISGRLRKMEINDSEAFDMHTISDGNMIRPSFQTQTIMYFPACEPEKDLDTGYTAGVINWVELVLKPSSHYSTSGLGSLFIIEREKTYDTRGSSDRVYGLTDEFNPTLPIKRSREIISDVNTVEVNTFEIEELRGVVVTKDGDKYPVANKRILVSMNITVSHPKDNKIWLSDQCSVINNVQVVKFAGGEYLELLQVYSSGAGGSALVKYNSSDLNVSVGSSIGTYRVTAIYSDSIGMKEPGSEVERLLVKRPD